MIIDVRYNGGGFVDQLIFERLRRMLAGMGSARNWESSTVPPNVFHGSMAASPTTTPRPTATSSATSSSTTSWARSSESAPGAACAAFAARFR